MKKELLKIFEIELADSQVKEDVLLFAENLIDFYQDKRKESSEKFKKTLEKYNFDTISSFSESSEYPYVTLFHGSGGLEFWVVIDYEGGVSGIDKEIGTIVEEPIFWLDDDKYPDNLKDEVMKWNWELKERIVFIWLSSIWQEINGYDYGIVTKTLENNSVRQFIFNDLAWDSSSEYTNYNNKNKRLERHFDNDLSIAQINERVKKFN